MDENINKIANDFLKELVDNIKEKETSHFFALGKQIHIFTRKEETGYSIICLSLDKLAKWFIMQQQIKRKNGGTGPVDFLVKYKDYLIALEVKTAHLKLTDKKISDTHRLFKKVEDALSQLDGLGLGKFDFLLNNSKGLIKIAFISIVFSGISKSIELRNSRILKLKDNNDVQEKIKIIPKMIKKKVNKEFKIIEYWKFDEELKYPRHHHKEPDKYGLYDGILFLAHYR